MDVVEEESRPPAALPEYGAAGESGRSSPSPAASPEFEFWMVGKNPPSFPSPALLTADELFSGGIVLPLHTLQPPPSDGGDEGGEGDAEDGVEEEEFSVMAEAGEVEGALRLAESGPAPTPDLPAVTFKWKDIFKAAGGEAKDRKKTERRVSSVGGSGNSDLININIWPFSRSRSAGHSAAAPGALTRAKAAPNATPNANAAPVATAAAAPSATAALAPAPRKVSSAPCSRSNSRGESSGPAPAPAIATAAGAATAAAAAPLPATSMLRRFVPGQGRASLGATGIRLGRASPVWQLRRNKLQQQAAAEQKHNDTKKKATDPTTTTTTTTATTTQDVDVAVDGEDKAAPSMTTPATATAGCRNNAEAGEEGNPPQGHLFGLRTFFSKKVY